jgi:hypothetical protein
MSNWLTRRNFLAASTAGTAAAGLAACGPASSTAPEVPTPESSGENSPSVADRSASADGFSLIYCDDSGSSNDGLVVFSWVEVKPDQWASVLGAWMNHRKSLYVRYGVPPSVELDASELVAGRGSPSLDATFNASSDLRRELVQDSVRAIGEIESLDIGTVYRRTPERGRAYQQVKGDVYSELLRYWDDRCAREGSFSMVSLDGDGSDKTYLKAHRRLDPVSRRIVEDPRYLDSPSSQWTQMADFLSWCAYQAQRRHPAKESVWGWYDEYVMTLRPNSVMTEV